MEAEAVFRIWTTADGQNPDAFYDLALSQALLGRTAEALEGFTRAWTLDNRRADACFEIAAAFLKMTDHVRALDWVKKGLSLQPRDAFGLELAGTIQFLGGATASALRYGYYC